MTEPAVDGSADLTNRLRSYCETKDPAGLPGSVAKAQVAMTVTNGVSTTELRDEWVDLYCLTKPLPGTVDPDTSSPDGGALANTGGVTMTATVAGGVILLGMALLVAPARCRRD